MDKERRLTALGVIKWHCLNDCQGGNSKLVKECSATKCIFWIYREGHDPKRKGISPHKRNGKGKFVKKKTKYKRIVISGEIEEIDYEKS